MATKFSPCKGSYVLNQFPSNVMFGMNGFHVSASGAIQGHHGPLVLLAPLAVGQQAYVMACCPSFVRPCIRLSVCVLTFSLNIFFSETT